MKLLHIDSSPLGDSSVSRELTRRIVGHLCAVQPDVVVEHLDLAMDPPTHLSGDSLSFHADVEATGMSEQQRRENSLSARLVDQFLASDVIVVGAPMYNFSVPSQLKAWIDRVSQAGKTFKYTSAGPIGLATGKTVIVASSRGGVYSRFPGLEALDHQESYLRTVFNFFGIKDFRIVRAEGVALGELARTEAFERADAEIRVLRPVNFCSE